MRPRTNYLASFTPQRGQAVLIEAGTVHSLGDGVVVFEVQENSDVTFRSTTGTISIRKPATRVRYKPRRRWPVSTSYKGPYNPPSAMEATQPVLRERLVDCSHFRLWRLQSAAPFHVGAEDEPRVLVCIEGAGSVEHNGRRFRDGKRCRGASARGGGRMPVSPRTTGHAVGNRCSGAGHP